MAKLAHNVNVGEVWFGPDHGDEDVPADVAKVLGPKHPAWGEKESEGKPASVER